MTISSRRKQTPRQLSYQALEPRQLLAGLPIITEFLASNSNGEPDDNGSTSDWIEIYNAGDTDINLAGFTLTDDADNPERWTFPSTVLKHGEFLVVRAASDAAPTQGSELFTGFGLSSEGEYVGIYDPAGNVVSEFGTGGDEYPTQYSDVSYGVRFDGNFDQVSYFSTPTPGEANTNPVAGVTERVRASVDAGFYEDSFQVSLTTSTPESFIGFTTDGSTPDPGDVNLYTGPITISSTTNLRAFSIRPGYLTLPDRTWSYIFVDDVLSQSNNGENPAGFPAVGSVNHALDYGIDTEVIAEEGEQAVKDALLAIPSWSVTTDLDNLFDPGTGIYVHSQQDGIAWERPASLEQLNPDGSEGFQVNAGIRIRGGASRSTTNPKHSFKFFFRNEYGDSSLEYDLFEGDPTATTSFQKIDLRTAQNHAWSRNGSATNQFITDVLTRRNQAALGQEATRSTWVHLYLNGQYWGLYQTQERADANFGASYFGGDADNYDVLKPERGPYTNIATDGNFDAYDRLYQQALARASDGVTPAFIDDAAYYRAQGLNPDGTDNPNFETLLDVENLTAYMLVILHSGNTDAPISNFLNNNRINNYFALRDRTGDEGFRFFIHDSEHSYRSSGVNRNGPYNHSNFESGVEYFNPQWLHQQLMANDEYRIQFADRVQESFYNDGGMSVEAQIARLEEEKTAIDQAIIAESARWGDAISNVTRMRSDWVSAVDSLQNLITGRYAVVLSQFKNTDLVLKNGNGNYNVRVDAPLFPNIDPPVFLIDGVAQHGGQIDAGQELQLISASEGTILYTTDGTDPREVGGNVSSGVQIYDGTVSTSTLFTTGSAWQYLDIGEDQGTEWKEPGFDDSTWASDFGKFGFGDPHNTLIESGPTGNRHITTYFRKEFNSTGDYDFASLSINRDDGVVVYLNGMEIIRDNMPDGIITYDTPAENSIGGVAESEFVDFVFPASLLVAGVNTIAVEVHQIGPNSSDLGFDAELTVGQLTAGSAISLDTTTTVLSRTVGSDGTWSALQLAVFVVGQQSDIRISEVNFNPPDPTFAEDNAGHTDSDDFEFLELYNSSATGAVNLSGMQFDDGVNFVFGNEELGPSERAVIVKDMSAFQARYGNSIRILGQYGPDTSLSNGGEQVRLVDSLGQVIHDFTYSDMTPWPVAADGDGPSLEVVNLNGDYSDPANWRASATSGGTPGEAPVEVAPQVASVIRDGGSISRPDLWTRFTVQFSADVDVNVAALSVVNDSTGGTPVNLNGISLSYDMATSTATWDLSSLNTVLPAAFYTVTLNSNLISGSNGGSLLDGNGNGSPGGSYTTEIYQAIPGDANLDGVVDISKLKIINGVPTNIGDASILLSNLGQTIGQSWTGGNFNGDSDVDISQFDSATFTNVGDASILLANLGQSVVPPTAATASSFASVAPSATIAVQKNISPVFLPTVIQPLPDAASHESKQLQTNGKLLVTGPTSTLFGSQVLDDAFADQVLKTSSDSESSAQDVAQEDLLAAELGAIDVLTN